MLAAGHTVSFAAEAADIPRRTVYDLRTSDSSFATAWDEALERGVDALEEEARRRAVDGVDKPVFQQGVLVGTIREYSDGLLLKLLQAKRPGVYREHYRHEHVGRVDHRIRLDKLSDRELDQLEKLMEKASE